MTNSFFYAKIRKNKQGVFDLKKKISFIGAGNMASAMIGGMQGEICVYDKNASQYEKFKDRKIVFADSIKYAVDFGDLIFLCVKPQNFDEIAPEISACDLSGKTVVSILAGVTVSRIGSAIGSVPIIRAIPNTPMMIGKGVTGICRSENVDDRSFSEVCRAFSSLGEVVALKEEQMNAMTAATSSAPAYVYLFIKSIVDSASKMGLDDRRMTEYISKMVIGSAEMLMRSGKTPDQLISMVTSPKGTTAEAMKVFEERNFSGIIDEAMIACERRAGELAGK